MEGGTDDVRALRVAVLGAGSLGTVIAGAIAARTHAELVVYSRGEHGKSLEANDLRVVDADGGVMFTVTPNRWTVLTDQYEDSADHAPVDVAIFAGKTTGGCGSHLLDVASKLIKPSTLLLSVSNGIWYEEALVARFGSDQCVLAATCSHGAYRSVPGEVVWAGRAEIVLGSLDPNKPLPGEEEGLATVNKLLEEAGLSPRIVPDGRAALWRKFLLNCAINGITALTGRRNGALHESPLWTSVIALAAEGVAVAQAEGVAILGMEMGDELNRVLKATKHNVNSMLQDTLHQRSTEIDALNGALVEKARAHGLHIPLNQMINALVIARSSSESLFL